MEMKRTYRSNLGKRKRKKGNKRSERQGNGDKPYTIESSKLIENPCSL